jgi:protein TonB
MIDSLHGPLLSDFAHRGLPDSRDSGRRVTALAATATFYAALLLLTWHGFEMVLPPRGDPAPIETVRLFSVERQPRLDMRDFTIRMIRPRAENAPMPQIVIAPEPAAAPRATFTASAAKDTPLAGGAASGNAAGASGVGTGGSGKGMAACMDAAYLQQIMHHVGRWYAYPHTAKDLGITGVAYVHFLIDKGGHYHALNVMQSSGSKWLDQAAMDTMRQAEPLPPIPDRFHTDRLDGVMPIVYSGPSHLVAQRLGSDPSGC